MFKTIRSEKIITTANKLMKRSGVERPRSVHVRGDALKTLHNEIMTDSPQTNDLTMINGARLSIVVQYNGFYPLSGKGANGISGLHRNNILLGGYKGTMLRGPDGGSAAIHMGGLLYSEPSPEKNAAILFLKCGSALQDLIAAFRKLNLIEKAKKAGPHEVFFAQSLLTFEFLLQARAISEYMIETPFANMGRIYRFNFGVELNVEIENSLLSILPDVFFKAANSLHN